MRSSIPLNSTAYPATTSDSVSAWSKGVRLASSNKSITNVDIKGKKRSKFQDKLCAMIKSWKWDDWEWRIKIVKIIVIYISKEIICTTDLTTAIKAYRDNVSEPTHINDMFEKRVIIKWYRIILSTLSEMWSSGLNTKFKDKSSWALKKLKTAKGTIEETVCGIK
jgi:hypothetical protein